MPYMERLGIADLDSYGTTNPKSEMDILVKSDSISIWIHMIPHVFFRIHRLALCTGGPHLFFPPPSVRTPMIITFITFHNLETRPTSKRDKPLKQKHTSMSNF